MQGQRGLSTNSSEYNAQDFMISQMLGRIATAEPVRVVAGICREAALSLHYFLSFFGFAPG